METLLWWALALFFVFLLFATAEAASQLLSTPKVQMLLDGKRQRSAAARSLLPAESGALRSTLSFGRMLSVAALAAMIAIISIGDLGIGMAAASGALFLSFFLPTLLAVANPKLLLSLLLPIVMLANILLLPLTLPRRRLFRRYKKSIRRRSDAENEEEEAQQIEAYLDAAEQDGLFEPSEAEMVRLVVDFTDTTVREVMTPRVDMVCIDKRSTLKAFRELAAEHKLSRFPVIDDIIDNLVGIAHIKSLLALPMDELEKRTVVEIMTEPMFVPEFKHVSALLRDFQRAKQQMSIVVDEYGGIAGLVTLEDIVEELVGEIEDEHETEEEETEIVEQPDGSLVVMGYVDVDEVEKLLGVPLDDEAYETVSGLALDVLKRIPVPGEKFSTRGVEFEILEADEKSIVKMRLARITNPEQDEGGHA